MKCAFHQDHEAIAFCQTCGNALCQDCRINIRGIAHCQTCLDAGRVHRKVPGTGISEEHPPRPLGPVTSSTRRSFLFGIIGMMMLAVSIHILWIYPFFYRYDLIPFYLNFIPETIGLAVIAVGVSLCGFAFDEFKNYFNYRGGFYISLLTILSPWMRLFSNLLLYTGLVYVQVPPSSYLSNGPLYYLFSGLSRVGTLLFGVLMIIWPIALLSVRKHSQSRSLTTAASVLFLLAAHYVLIWSPIFGWFFFPIIVGISDSLIIAILIEPAAVITAVIFSRLRASIPRE